mgnify:CR=1 FL=1
MAPYVRAQFTIAVWTDKPVYNVGEPVRISFETGGPGATGSATIDVYGPVSYRYGPINIVTGSVYTATVTGVTVVPGFYNVKVTLGLMLDVYQGYTSFQVVEARPAFDFKLTITPTSTTVKQSETAKYTLGVTFSDPSYQNKKITITSVSGLGPGMEWKIEPGNQLAIRTSDSTPPGPYVFTVTGTAEGISRTVTGTLTVEALKPALTYVSVTGIPPTEGPVYVGQTSTTIVVISNTGNAKARAVKVVLEDLTPSAGVEILRADPPKDIGPLETGQWTIEVRALLPGKYTGMLRTYSGTERVLEQVWKLDVAAPEISIASKEVSPKGDTVYLGDTITITYRLSNPSPVDARELNLDVRTSDGLVVLDLPAITEIGAGSEVEAIIKLRADKLGDAWTRLVVSSYGDVVQEDQLTFEISERPVWEQQWFLAAIGGGAAALVIALLVLRRRGPKAPRAVLTQPSAPIEPSSNMCPTCGKPLTFVQAHSRWYCTKCKEYV